MATNFAYPNFNVPFPYANLPAQLAASMQAPPQGSYGRWNGTGVTTGAPLGGGTGGGVAPTPMPGAVAGPGGTYPMPMNPQYIDPTKVPMGGIGAAPPGPPLTGITSVPPAGFGGAPGAPVTIPGAPVANGAAVPNGAPIAKPMDNQKMAQAGGGSGLFAMPQIPDSVAGGNQAFSLNRMPTGADSTSAALQHLLASGRGAGFAQAMGLGQGPQNVTVNDFNRVAQTNPGLAFQLLQSGGGAFQQAVQQGDSLAPQAMNNWINGQAYYNGPQSFQGLTPQNLALLTSMGLR